MLDICSVAWCASLYELDRFLMDYMHDDKKWITLLISSIPTDGGHNSYTFTVTPKGYDHLDEQFTAPSNGPNGFIAMWFDREVENAWLEGIEPAIRETGYKPLRIDGHQHNNRIDDEIMAQIRKSRFVVADFTGQRGGVYFEAGFALGLGIPVIWTVRENELTNIHFDNRQYNFLVWSAADIPAFKTALKNRIEATLGMGPEKDS